MFLSCMFVTLKVDSLMGDWGLGVGGLGKPLDSLRPRTFSFSSMKKLI